jgi:DNA-binding NtrC family response regulator
MSCVCHHVENKTQVLVIDDEPSVADALRIILEDQCFGVVVAHTGREGIERACRAPFGVIITDLRLPDIDGLEVIGALRAGGPVILITSHGTPEIFARARERGAYGIITKPFLPSDIIRLVTAALDARRDADAS